VVWRTAGLFHATLHVGIEFLAPCETVLRGEDGFRGLSGELASSLRRAGLHDHRPALDRPSDVQRPADRIVLVLMVEHMHLCGIEVDAGFDVANEGVIRPGIPQAGHHIVEFAGTAVALVVLDMLRETEIQCRIGIGRGDDVPAGAAAADMVERSETPRDVVGGVEGGGAGRYKADAFGHGGKRRQQRERLERRRRVAALQRIDGHVQDRQVIGHEERVEPAALQRLREALQVSKVEICIGEGARIAPRPGVDAGRPHEGAEFELT
jgi:hypothetical protein